MLSVYNETLFLIVCLQYSVGVVEFCHCFLLCSRQPQCVWFCLKLNFLWWNSSNGLTVGYCTCLWRMWAATRCTCLFPFFLQSQGQCEVFSEHCWPHGLHGLRSCQGLCPRYQHEQMFKQWPDLCWSTTLAKPWLSSSVTWGMSHSFSIELQHWRFLLCCQELER